MELNASGELIFKKGPIQDTLPWKLPELHFAGRIIERSSLKVLETRLNIIRNEIAKNMGLFYRAKPALDKTTIKAIYFSRTQPYLSYSLSSWTTMYASNLKLIKSMQKRTARIVVNPFRTAKPSTNTNHRLCLKSKPQVKCHWSFLAGSTLEGEAHTGVELSTLDTAHKLPNSLERDNPRPKRTPSGRINPRRRGAHRHQAPDPRHSP